jgi:hypothetical protein
LIELPIRDWVLLVLICDVDGVGVLDGVPKRGGFGGVTVRRDDGRSCAAALGVGVRAGVLACVGVALDDPVPLRVGVDLELVRASSRELANALAAATLVTALFSRCCCLTPREVSSSLAALDGGRSSPVPSPVRLARAAASAAGLAE